MTVPRVLPLLVRVVAIVLAAIGVVDPRLQRAERVPPAVDLHVASHGGDEAVQAARAIASQVERSLAGRVAFNGGAAPAARVVVGDVTTIDPSATDVPVSSIALRHPQPPNVAIIAAGSPPAVPRGWSARVVATVEGVGMAGRTTTLVLEQNGVILAQATHAWRKERERTQLELFFPPPAAGTGRVTIRAQPADGETFTHDNRADLGLTTTERRFSVLVHEPRLSWSSAFVRRALEDAATFDVSALSGASRGLAVRAGAAPQHLTAASLAPFDLVVSGAPEALTRSDVDALRSFVRVRGGTVIFVPDRRPSGPYLDIVPAARFEEMLVESALPLRSSQPGSIRASELAIPRDVAGGRILAAVEQKNTELPIIVEWLAGAGRVVFAGALDAWRFRNGDGEGYATFWQSLIATEALQSPRKLELSIDPRVARPGEIVTIRARLRRTELDEAATRTRTPPVDARLIGAAGALTPIRLWPTAEPGEYEGRIAAPADGRYDVRVSAGSIAADDVLRATADVRRADGGAERQSDAANAIAAATGGLAVTADDLSALGQRLEALPHREVVRSRHPARSLLFVSAFAGLLCTEWALRRRRGLR